MSTRIVREREFHNKRFAENPERRAALQGLSQGITHDALGITYAAIQKRFSKPQPPSVN